MKKLSKLLMLVAVVVFTASCDNTNPNNATTIADINTTDVKDVQRTVDFNETTAQTITETKIITFNGKQIKFNIADIMMATSNENAQTAAAEDATNLVNALMGADKEAQTLDVNFSMADEPVENGMFVFSIETENAKDLTMQMFDEEGFGMVANNSFNLTQGSNYKALNVNALNSGSYIFRIKDADGKELQRTVEVANK